MTNKKLLLGLGVALSLFATGCDPDSLTDANQNPNDPTDAPSSALFTTAARLAATRWVDGVDGTRYGFLPQHLAQVQYPDDDQYLAARLGAAATSGLFNGSYNQELQDLKVVIDRGIEANEPGLWAPAIVLSMWEFGILTDVFGDIPFSEAFNPAVLRPAYDAQADIYTAILDTLASSSAALAGASNELGAGDPIYGGDPASWRRFANSLRLRHAMRLSNKAGTDATVAAAVTAATADAGGLILTNAQNAELPWPGDGIYDFPWADNFKTRDDHRVSARFIETMRSLSDPRVAILAQPAETVIGEQPGMTVNYCPGGGATCYVGLQNALLHEEALSFIANTSRPGEIFFPPVTSYGTFEGDGVSYPSRLMTAAEVEFLLAEAAERGIGGVTGAATHYINGITRHMEMLGVPGADITTYVAARTAEFAAAGTTTARLNLIYLQKWIALYSDPIQAWSDIRRTCQPAFVEPGPEARFDIIPRRFQYSTTENAVNSANRNAAVERQWGAGGSDSMINEIWWNTDWDTAENPTYVQGCSDSSQ